MDSTRRLLETHRFASLSVSAILQEAGVARGSFYFYFSSKEDLLAALVSDAVSGGLEAAKHWTATTDDPVSALRQGTAAGAALWREHAPVLRAIVEAAGTDPALDRCWRGHMDAFTRAALDRISADPAAQAWLEGRDAVAIISALTWMGERVYYLFATGTAPFENERTVVDVLTDAWTLAIYGVRAPAREGLLDQEGNAIG
jgi:AcrR family transcriptional regulator